MKTSLARYADVPSWILLFLPNAITTFAANVYGKPGLRQARTIHLVPEETVQHVEHQPS